MPTRLIRIIATAGVAVLLTAGVVSAQVSNETAKLLALDGAAEDVFGSSVAISGTTATVGASGDDDNGLQSGSAYLFDVTTGAQIAKLLPADGEVEDYFGCSVAISGATAIVGAYLDDDGLQSGSAYLFDTTTGAQIVKLLPADGAADDFFGDSVAISGTKAVVGAWLGDDNGLQSGSAYLFDTTTGAQIAKLLPTDGAEQDHFGDSVAVSGTTAIVGAWGDDDNGTDSGSAYLFDTITGAQIAKLLPSDGAYDDHFGDSVAISGTLAIVGATGKNDNGSYSGSAYLFDTITGAQISKLLPTDGAAGDHFGVSVAISGTMAIVGAHGDDDNGSHSGSAYLFDTTTGAQITKLLPTDGAFADAFGCSVAISGFTAIVGAYGTEDNGHLSGAAYLFSDVHLLPDCNENGIADADDISTGLSSDCNGNGVPDECDISQGVSADCNSTGIPDECEFAPLVSSQYCFCDTGAPCGNTDSGAGCANFSGSGSLLSACVSSSVTADDLVLTAESIQPGQFGLVFMGAGQIQFPFGNGQLCVSAGGVGQFRFPVHNSGSAGVIQEGPGIVSYSQTNFGVFGSISTGQSWNFQAWYRDPLGPCGTSFNLSNGLEITWTP